MTDADDARPDLRAARRCLLEAHRGTLAGVLSVADEVAAGFDGDGTTDADAVSGPLEAGIREQGLDRALVAALSDAVAAAGRELSADPVPAPPYLAVTSRGPVCRGTLSDGRLVVTVGAFRVERSGTDGGPVRTRYVRAGPDPEAALEVRFVPGR